MNEINYAQLAGAYKGCLETLAYNLAMAKILDMSKLDELTSYILKEIERIETTYR